MNKLQFLVAIKVSDDNFNELSGLQKDREICDLMSYYQLMKNCGAGIAQSV
jgi:hypothetical protein